MALRAVEVVESHSAAHSAAEVPVALRTPALDETPTRQKVRRQEWASAMLYLLLDILCWVVIYGIVGYARRDAFLVTAFEFFLVDCVALFVIVQALFIVGGYNPQTETRSLTYTTEHILAMLAAAVISSFILYSAATFDQSMRPSRGVLLVSFVIFLPFSLGYRRFLRGRLAATAAERCFLVVGGGGLARQFYQQYQQTDTPQQLEFVDDDPSVVGKPIGEAGSPIVEGGITQKLSRLSSGFSGVILAKRLDASNTELLERLVRTQFQQTRVYTLESFHETQWRSVPLDVIDPIWPLQTGFQLARISPYHYLKRLFDLALTSVLVVICSPLLVTIGLLVWLTDGRPVVFRQIRVGRENQPFTAFKFRTMRTNGARSSEQTTDHGPQTTGPLESTPHLNSLLDREGEAKEGSVAGTASNNQEQITDNPAGAAVSQQSTLDSQLVAQDGAETAASTETFHPSASPTDESAVADLNHSTVQPVDEVDEDIYTRERDPRVTKLGRVLRKLRLDELPQLFNVLRGDMSLIGPRAEWIKCAELYEKKIPFYHFRHLVKPGITGWAQVNYPYGESEQDAIEKLKYDLYYIRNYSLKLDAMIFLKTIHTVLFGKGR